MLGSPHLMKRIAVWAAVFTLIPAPALPGPGTAPARVDDPAAVLKALAAFEPGTDDAVLLDFQKYVRSCLSDPAAKSECESALLAFLQGEATLAGKQAVCREFRIVGSAKSVPVLEKMLLSGETTDMARYALEGIPGDASGEALIRALDVVRGALKLGVISSLGNMKFAGASQALARSLASADDSEAAAATAALGGIGGPGAWTALTTALGPSFSLSRRDKAASGLLACAESLSAAGDDPPAADIYEKILSAKVSPAIRRAAMKGKIGSSGGAASKTILGVLKGKDPEMLQPAIAMIPGAFSGTDVGEACALLPGLPEDAQVQLIAVLARFPKDAVLATLMQAASASPSQVVRIEAIGALALAGDKTCVGFLSDRAARTSSVEQAAARDSLARVRGGDVDAAILDRLASARDNAVLGELIRAAGERRIRGSLPTLIKLAVSGVPMVRSQAFRAIRRLAGAEDLVPLLGLLMDTEDESDLDEIAAAVASAASREARPSARAEAVESLLSTEKDPLRRASLMLVLGKIGEDRTLPILRRALAEDPQAVKAAAEKALIGWPTPAARDDVLAIARTSTDPVAKILALQGYVRMIALERYRAPEGAVASLAEALALAQRPEERRLVLGALPGFACPAALRMAESLLGSADVGAEARAAADSIKDKLSRKAL